MSVDTIARRPEAEEGEQVGEIDRDWRNYVPTEIVIGALAASEAAREFLERTRDDRDPSMPSPPGETHSHDSTLEEELGEPVDGERAAALLARIDELTADSAI